MDKEIEKTNTSYYKYSESGIKKRNIELWSNVTNYSNEELTFKEKFYLYENELKVAPLCYCGSKLKFIDMNSGFRKFCSNKCSVNSEEIKLAKQITCLDKYGVTNPSKSDLIKNKVRETNMGKFGVEYPLQSEDIRNQYKQKFINNWGVDNPSKVQNIRQKAKETMKNKYGVEHAMNNDDIKNTLKGFFMEKYGVENPSKLPEVRKKASDTMLKKYGVTDALKLEEFREKSKITSLNKWGKEYFTQTDIYKNRINEIVFNKGLDRVNDEYNLLLEIQEYNYIIKCLLCQNDFKINKQLWRSRNRTSAITCIKCNPISNSSSLGEVDLFDFISSIYSGPIIRNYRQKKEIDIYLPDLKIGFEYNGLYWHSEAFKDKNYHSEKWHYFKERGITIYGIWEDDYLFKKEIVSSIIRAKTGKIENKIYARKCEIRFVTDNKIIRNFLDENHLQGYIGSKYKVGLFFEDELVSLMTFGNMRIALNQKSHNNNYELLRYCNKLNTVVIGGASKMISFFISSQKPEKIISYSDNSRSIGNIYQKLGFELVGESISNYCWYKDNQRYHRFNYRKDKLVALGYDKSMTEVEIMHSLGYLRIFDYGQKKWALDIKRT